LNRRVVAMSTAAKIISKINILVMIYLHSSAMNTASMLGPHTYTNRGTRPDVGF
jgi:hypothetical protein